MNRLLPREVAQVVKVPTTLDCTEWGRVIQARSCLGTSTLYGVLLLGERSQGTTGNVSRMHVCSGDIP